MDVSPHPKVDFAGRLDRVKEIGAAVIAPASVDVDANARFPAEAFEALKAEGLLSAYVPASLGGMGLSMTQICRICEVLGRYCASTGMIYAMHQIQVACLVHNAPSTYF
jgi:acyl-CoA dehydrogenase